MECKSSNHPEARPWNTLNNVQLMEKLGRFGINYIDGGDRRTIKLIQNHYVLREYQCAAMSLLVSWMNTVWLGLNHSGHGYNIDMRSCGDQ
mmetsp:Transcript_2716/g.3062  ORF Transcript_2716/g.3062 Transcript_2716/m.3062 type:complete len:91 (+) Transcript_2716:192-464(+)